MFFDPAQASQSSHPDELEQDPPSPRSHLPRNVSFELVDHEFLIADLAFHQIPD